MGEKVVLSRYADGEPMIWTEGGEGNGAPVVHMGPEEMVDISMRAKEIVDKKLSGVSQEDKHYIYKRELTQCTAEAAFCDYFKLPWREGERYTIFNGRTKINNIEVIVKGTSDYHGDLVVPSWHLRGSASRIFVLGIRFGNDEKVILRGWVPMKLVKNIGTPFKINSTNRFASQDPFYKVKQEDLFPVKILMDKLSSSGEFGF